MTSAAVVSFPTVGGVISKSLGRIAGSLLGATAALIIAGHTLNEPWLFLFSMAAWIGFCTWACAHFTNNAAYAFQLSGYTAAIIAFPMVNIVEITQLWDIAQARVCEVIVGILCGGMMMMILPSHIGWYRPAHRVEKHACALAGTCQSTVAAGDYRRYPLRA